MDTHKLPLLVKQWAEDVGWDIDHCLGIRRIGERRIWVIRDFRVTGETIFELSGEDIVIKRADDDYWETWSGLINAVLDRGARFRRMDDDSRLWGVELEGYCIPISALEEALQNQLFPDESLGMLSDETWLSHLDSWMATMKPPHPERDTSGGERGRA